MASSEEYKDFKKLLYWKERSVANPAGVGGVIGYGHTLQNFKVLLYTCTQKMFEQPPTTPSPPEKKFGLCQTNLNPSPRKITWITPAVISVQHEGFFFIYNAID